MRNHENTVGWLAIWIITFSLALLVGWCLNAEAQTWVTANEKTIGWDPVTTLADGTTQIPAEDVVKYRVYLANAKTDPNKTNPAVLVDSQAELQYTVTLNVDGRYFPGVSALRYVEGDPAVVMESEICWSDSTECTAMGPFGLRWHVPPGAVKKLGAM